MSAENVTKCHKMHLNAHWKKAKTLSINIDAQVSEA